MEVKAKKSTSSDTHAAAGRRSSTSNNRGSSGATAAVERKEIERRRRQHMKNLCVKLASLIPKEHYSSKDTMTQLGSLDEAAAYIKTLKERVAELHQKRISAQILAGMRGGGGEASTSAATTTNGGAGSEETDEEAVTAPVVEVRHHHDGSSLDVVLISSVERPFKLHEVVTVLEEEGAEILNANVSAAGRKIFCTIHSRAFSSRIGIEVSRVAERLRALLV
ncbi:transcription factor bHLH168-like [Phragmites australis]|uniref:transcription factor bHLH168-like n=1 Tax=Phragmites australis TaxID=29695 RepID=UPI002D7A113C|nr:transcription factor bHLH168-like [Phragmites australis]XP_062183440.1 transcription factor bHLH168-like [Phragmites australis]